MKFKDRMNKNFYPALEKFVGEPFNYLEVGVFRGATLKWVLDNIGIHKDSHLVGIDPWNRSLFSKHDVRNNNDWNELLNSLAKMADLSQGKIQLIKGYSNIILTPPPFKKEYFHAVYIDGEHTTTAVLVDFSLTWDLLKSGGVMIFDDYNQEPVMNAVDMILKRMDEMYKLLFKNRQLGIEKL